MCYICRTCLHWMASSPVLVSSLESPFGLKTIYGCRADEKGSVHSGNKNSIRALNKKAALPLLPQSLLLFRTQAPTQPAAYDRHIKHLCVFLNLKGWLSSLGTKHARKEAIQQMTYLWWELLCLCWWWWWWWCDLEWWSFSFRDEELEEPKPFLCSLVFCRTRR